MCGLIAAPRADHGVAAVLFQGFQELRRLLGGVGVIAVHHDQEIAVRLAEEALNGIAFALARLCHHLGSSRPRHLRRVVRARVIDDQNPRLGK